MSASSARKYMSKRQRPCDFCRARKTACRIEGSLPCRLCALHNRQCTFLDAAHPKKRANPSIGSEERPELQKGLSDKRAGSTPSEVSAGRPETSAEMDFLSTHQSPPQGHSGNDTLTEKLIYDHLSENFFGDFNMSAANLQSDWPFLAWEGEMSPEVQNFSARSHASPICDTNSVHLDSDSDLNPQILGYSGDMDPFLLRNYRYDSTGAFKFKQLSIQSVVSENMPVQFLLSSPAIFSSSRQEMGLTQMSFQDSRMELETVVSIDTGRRLISLYRRFILPHYPIFSEQTFPDAKNSPPYLLAAIYLIAQPFARFDEVLSIELAYDTLDSRALFKLILEALQHEAHDPSLLVVQTLLLLVARPSTNPLILESSLKWSLHGSLVATAQSLGLNHDPTSWSIAPWQKALRRRLSCTIFGHDKWLACSIGRPPLITEDNWLVTTLNSEDNQSSGIDLQAWSQCIQFSLLGTLLAKVLNRLL